MTVSSLRKTSVRRVERETVVERVQRRPIFTTASLRWRGDALTLRRSEVGLAHVSRSNGGWHMRVTGDSKLSDAMSRKSATEAAEVIVLQFLSDED